MSKRTPSRPTRYALRRAKLLRKDQTLAETILWGKLRNRGLLDLKFRRQHPIGRYIVDFFCSSKNMIVEVDGGVHVERKVHDRLRTEWLQEQGYRVVRFANREVYQRLLEVLEAIVAACTEDSSSSP